MNPPPKALWRTDRPAPEAPDVQLRGRWLVADLGSPHSALSWAVLGSGRTTCRRVLWCQVRDADLPVGSDPQRFLLEHMQKEGVQAEVGLMTSGALAAFRRSRAEYASVHAECVATVGLSNAVCVGDPPGQARGPCTINILCRVSRPLGREAELELMSLVSEARTLAVLQSERYSRVSGRVATGTGTDCIVVAAPLGPDRAAHAGKHTVLGHVVGRAVYEAVAAGAKQWMQAHDSARVGP